MARWLPRSPRRLERYRQMLACTDGPEAVLAGTSPVDVYEAEFATRGRELLEELGIPLGKRVQTTSRKLRDLVPDDSLVVRQATKVRYEAIEIVTEVATSARVPMESVDRTAAGRIEGLPGGTILRMHPGREDLLVSWSVTGPSEVARAVAEAWQRVLVRSAEAAVVDATLTSRLHDPETDVSCEGDLIIAHGEPDLALAVTRTRAVTELGPVPRDRAVNMQLQTLVFGANTPEQVIDLPKDLVLDRSDERWLVTNRFDLDQVQRTDGAGPLVRCSWSRTFDKRDGARIGLVVRLLGSAEDTRVAADRLSRAVSLRGHDHLAKDLRRTLGLPELTLDDVVIAKRRADPALQSGPHLQLLRELETPSRRPIELLCWGPDHQLAFSDGTTIVRSGVSTGAHPHALEVTPSIKLLGWRHGHLLGASTTDAGLTFVSLPEGAPLVTIPDGMFAILAGCESRAVVEVNHPRTVPPRRRFVLVDLDQREVVAEQTHPGALRAVSAAGTHAYLAHDLVSMFDGSRVSQVRRLFDGEETPCAIASAPTANNFVVATTTMIWISPPREHARTLLRSTEFDLHRALAIDATLRFLASYSVRCGLELWDHASQEVVARDLNIVATTQAFSPDGTLLAAGTAEGRVRVYALPLA